MIAPLIDTLAATLPMLEITLLATAGFAAARRRGLPVAEAAAYAVMGSLMIVSGLLQISLLLGLPAVGAALESITAVLAVSVIVTLRTELTRSRGAVAALAAEQPVFFTTISMAGVYLAVRALLSPPLAMDRPALEFLAATGRALTGGQPVTALSLPALPPLNSAVLPWTALRLGTETGTGIFGFAAYLILGTATYALSRRYAWPPTALTVALIVLSMPRFVLHAGSCGFELIPTAAALVSVLAIYRSLESPNAADSVMILYAICFTMTDGPYCLVLPSVLAALATFLLCRRHGWRYWKSALQRNRSGVLAAMPILFLFSQALIFAANLSASKPWAGTLGRFSLKPNPGGIGGALANAVRYLIQTIHLPPPVDCLWEALTGGSLARGLESAHGEWIAPLLEKGLHLAPLTAGWGLDPRTCWFGPFAFLLSLPALGYAFFRAPRRLKALTVAMTGYIYLLALMGAWNVLNVRYFSPFFRLYRLCHRLFPAPLAPDPPGETTASGHGRGPFALRRIITSGTPYRDPIGRLMHRHGPGKWSTP